jgi:tetratricopeptide (TPR) repeat protein
MFLGVHSGAAIAAESLGKIDFPTTGTAPARAHFVRGVLALHSFFYDEALDEFRAATQAEPGFAMGYWGEAMAHNHTIWDHQDTEAARAALGKIGATSRLRARERAWIDAVRLLYGNGEKPARDRAYAQALEKMAREYPDDLEVASFQAVALLGTLDSEEPALATRMRAGALALEVLAKNPDHPGAAHYVIHAFDDADHARIALAAARRYAQIAPAAFHARHMPSHIFVNLGMWEEAAAANESSFAASEAWVTRRKHPTAKLDFHSLGWLAEIYHQQGRLKKTEETVARFARLVEESSRAARCRWRSSISTWSAPSSSGPAAGPSSKSAWRRARGRSRRRARSDRAATRRQRSCPISAWPWRSRTCARRPQPRGATTPPSRRT